MFSLCLHLSAKAAVSKNLLTHDAKGTLFLLVKKGISRKSTKSFRSISLGQMPFFFTFPSRYLFTVGLDPIYVRRKRKKEIRCVRQDRDGSNLWYTSCFSKSTAGQLRWQTKQLKASEIGKLSFLILTYVLKEDIDRYMV